MLVGIVADSHDHLEAARDAVALMRARGVERILHAGDIISPFAVKAFLEGRVDVDAVFGNNDGEKRILSELLRGITEGHRRLALEGRTVVLVHDRADLPDEEAARADLVVFGHNHYPEVKETDGRIELNPGEVCGWLTRQRTLALWDTKGGLPEIVEF
ncbi:MAG: metallophosphoesterase [Planctomycetota bacterium]|jgi:putative phosphoesterase